MGRNTLVLEHGSRYWLDENERPPCPECESSNADWTGTHHIDLDTYPVFYCRNCTCRFAALDMGKPTND
jgi:hypothetical protein